MGYNYGAGNIKRVKKTYGIMLGASFVVGKPISSMISALFRQLIIFVPAALILPHFLGVEGVLWAFSSIIVEKDFNLFLHYNGYISVRRFTERRKQVTDKELIRKVQSGEKEALNEIAEKYYDDIYRFCRYLTGHETDSYDITQEVFFRFIKYVDSYRDKNLKGYLLMIARNLCRNYYSGRKETISLEETMEAGQDNCPMNGLENELFLRQMLQEIPREQREVVVLRIYEECRFREIAGMLDCNLSTVKSRFRLGISNMRKRMEMLDDKKKQ